MTQHARLSETRPFEASSSIKTELGYMRALCSPRGVAQLVWQQQPFSAGDDQESDVSRETIAQLSDYLAGQMHYSFLHQDALFSWFQWGKLLNQLKMWPPFVVKIIESIIAEGF